MCKTKILLLIIHVSILTQVFSNEVNDLSKTEQIETTKNISSEEREKIIKDKLSQTNINDTDQMIFDQLKANAVNSMPNEIKNPTISPSHPRMGKHYNPHNKIDLSKIDTQKILTNKTLDYGVRFAYGACFDTRFYNDQYKIFKNIAGQQPDVWIWIGDSIYAPGKFLFYTFLPSWSTIQSYYDEIKNNEHYKTLQNQARIIGIYDDKDYGMDDGDSTNPDKAGMKQMFQDFIDEPKDTDRRNRDGGIYTSYYFDVEKKAKLIMLDVNYERVLPDDLGPTQRKWLESQIMDEKDSEIFIINISVPAINNICIDGDHQSDFTKTEIFKLINRKNKYFLLITGEMHFAMISQQDFLNNPGRENDLYEITSSGLSHHIDHSFYVDRLVPQIYTNSTYIYDGQNYGVIDITKDHYNCEIHVMIKGSNGLTQLAKKFDCSIPTKVDLENQKSYNKREMFYELQKENIFTHWKVVHFLKIYNKYVEAKIIMQFPMYFTLIFMILVGHKTIINLI